MTHERRRMGRVGRAIVVGTCLVTFALWQPPTDARQLRREFRAVWVDTFNTTLNNHGDIRRVVDRVRAARSNVILAQVRRRGDAWYLDSREPPPDFVPWNKDPSLAPPTNGLPQDERHVFRQHSGFDPVRRVIEPGPENWLTRTLIADGPGISYQGHRLGSEFWLDFGHPAAAAHTVDVLAHLVRQYDIDGLHLDRVRYPELTATGQTPTTGASIGYNAVSLARYVRRHRLPPDSAPPAPADVRWADWRRDQVTDLVRRIYLTVTFLKPHVTVSAALIAFGGAPTSDASWSSAEAFWRVYQDWRTWLEEGILDVAMPMVYRRDHDMVQARQFERLDDVDQHSFVRSLCRRGHRRICEWR